MACSIQTPAHPNIPVGVTAFYKGATNSMNWSLVSQPAGSVATLTHTNGLIAALRPDVEGVYVIQDNVTGKTLTNTAASWTGAQFCTICHGPGNNVDQADIVSQWSQTEHATMAQRGVDGVLGSFYNESCFQCHTVGYNQVAGGDQQQLLCRPTTARLGFPRGLAGGELRGDARSAPESGQHPVRKLPRARSRHPGSPSVSLDAKVCAQLPSGRHPPCVSRAVGVFAARGRV